MTRRIATKVVAITALLASACSQEANEPAHSTGPDLIVYNADVYTVDDDTPRATAFAVSDGRFLAVGGDEIRDTAGDNTRLVDARVVF